MEDILASIRKIISDDSAPAAATASVKPGADEKAPEVPTHMSEDDLDKLFAQVDETSSEDDEDAAEDEPVELPAEEDVLELTEDAAVEEEALDLIEGFGPEEADLAFVDPPPKAAAEPAPQPRTEPRSEPVADRHPRVDSPDESLVSAQTSASVNAAFGALTHTILSNNAKTLDDLVKEMLRPMLKAWLDENLPVVVERMVRAEIERVSRGR